MLNSWYNKAKYRMISYWHSTVLGKYSPEERWMGLDFRNLFLDPRAAKLTHFHELTHSVLSRSTDFGQATEVIYQLLPKMNHLTSDDKNRIRASLRTSQIFCQEGIASLMEILSLKREIGKKATLDWAREHFTNEYYGYVEKFFFVLDLGQHYRDGFTQQIPHTALHTGIRTAIVQQDLLSDANKFVEYLKNEKHNPDARLKQMLSVIRYKTYIPTKSPEEICKLTGIEYVGDVTKQDAANFLNYAHKLAGNKVYITAENIKDSKNIDVLNEANDQIIIGNMNLNLHENATVLWKLDDILHYKDTIDTVLVNRFGDELENKDLIEQMFGNKVEAGLVAFTKTGESYVFGSDFSTVSNLLKNEFLECTLLVKWGLYKPGDEQLLYFDHSRNPNVVIYNNVQNLDDSFEEWFSTSNKAEYLFIGVSEKHPFQTIVVKDSNEVLHFLNTFIGPANKFISKYGKNLVKVAPENFLKDPRHFNNVLSVWGGMPREVDWYKSMLDGKEVHFR